VDGWGPPPASAATVHPPRLGLWNAVDAARTLERALTCSAADFSTVHRAHDHHQILIDTFSGESERTP